jgi:AAA+ superfamily predicted ATPase
MRLTAERIASLVQTAHPLLTIETDEEPRALACLLQAGTMAGRAVFVWNALDGLRSAPPAVVQRFPNTSKPQEVVSNILANDWSGIFVLMDICSHFAREPLLVRGLREFVQSRRSAQQTIVLLDTDATLPGSLTRWATPIVFPMPDEEEIENILRATFQDLGRYSKLESGLTRSELQQIVSIMRGLTANQVRLAVSRALVDDNRIDAADIPRFLDIKQEMIREGGLLEYVDATMQFEDLAGLANLKRWLSIRRHGLSPKARQIGLSPPRGILLLGVQGCGKSAACKAVAAAWQLPLLRLDPGRFYDRFVGESERNMRKAIHQAEAMSPCVLWIDEIEKAFASAGAESADGGLSKRMFGSLLHWLQEHRSPIFCVATANDISALPPELVRKGRFDEIFFVDLPGAAQRAKVFAIHLTRRKLDPAAFDLARLAAGSEGFSGAEMEQAIIAAMYTAFAADRPLGTEDIVEQLGSTRPLSVLLGERIAALRAWAADRCAPAD